MKGGVLSITPNDPWHGGYTAGLGLYAVITLPSGETHTYAHLSSVTLAPGPINAGQAFAKSGYSGNVQPPGPAGAHLHIGVRPANPDYANHYDGTVGTLERFDHNVTRDSTGV